MTDIIIEREDTRGVCTGKRPGEGTAKRRKLGREVSEETLSDKSVLDAQPPEL